MKLVYILAQGHSGSTLTVCILGTHPDFISSGELRYLNWQLEKTKDIDASVTAQNICTCERDFRECDFWSEVFERIKKKTGADIFKDPTSFDMAYFGEFAYQNRDGFRRTFTEKDLSKQHMVAGNPMRYRGKQQVRYDESWKERLSSDELNKLKNS